MNSEKKRSKQCSSVEVSICFYCGLIFCNECNYRDLNQLICDCCMNRDNSPIKECHCCSCIISDLYFQCEKCRKRFCLRCSKNLDMIFSKICTFCDFESNKNIYF